MKPINNSIVALIFSLILILEYFLIYGQIYSENEGFSHFLEMQLFFVYLLSLVTVWLKYGFTSLFSLFMLCLGLFNFQRIFLGYFVGLDYRIPDVTLYPNLKEQTVQKMLYIYTLFIFIITYSYIKLNSNINKNLSNFDKEISTNINLIKIGKSLMFIFLPFVLYRGVLEFILLIGRSFTDIYAENAFIDVPWYLKLSSVFFQVGFMMLLGGKPSMKTFFIFSIIYLVTYIPNLLIGLRAMFAVSFLFLFWYYTNIYNKKLSIFKTLLLLIPMILLLQYIAFVRTNSETDGNFFKNILTFLISQSQSMYVLAYYIQYKDTVNAIHSYPYVFDPLISWIFPSGQSLAVLKTRSALGHQLTYTINPNYYLGGGSLGTSFIAEIYEFGLFGIIIGAVIFSVFIFEFNKSYRTNKFLFCLSMFFVQYFFMAPRNSYLPNLYFLFRYVIVFVSIYFLFNTKNGVLSRKYIRPIITKNR